MRSRSAPNSSARAAVVAKAANAKSKASRVSKAILMSFEFLDGYLLDGKPEKAYVVKTLLANPSELPAASPYYEGLRMLGARAPDLAFVALRLVLAGHKADDASVVALRSLIEQARAAGAGDAERR